MISFEYKKASKYEKVRMGLSDSDELLVIEKILYANEEPVAFYIDRIPKKNLSTFDLDKEYFIPSIFL